MAPPTTGSGDDVSQFLDAAPEGRRDDARALRALMEEVTGEPAVMWGSSIVGFGSSSYTNTSGTHDWFAVGFAPRKAATVVYGVHEDDAPDPLLAELGPHTTGKGCLNLKRLADVDQAVLRRLIEQAWHAER